MRGAERRPSRAIAIINSIEGQSIGTAVRPELARRGLRFVRYADDCNIFVRSERAGQRVMASIRRFLKHSMRFQVNEEKSGVRSKTPPARGIRLPEP
jgi:hypothetical protein